VEESIAHTPIQIPTPEPVAPPIEATQKIMRRKKSES
jgi:hypothetical protein